MYAFRVHPRRVSRGGTPAGGSQIKVPFMLRLVIAAAAIAFIAAPAAAEIARVKRAYGDAHIRRGAVVLPASPGQMLLEQDILETGSDGRISLSFVDDTPSSVGRRAASR